MSCRDSEPQDKHRVAPACDHQAPQVAHSAMRRRRLRLRLPLTRPTRLACHSKGLPRFNLAESLPRRWDERRIGLLVRSQQEGRRFAR